MKKGDRNSGQSEDASVPLNEMEEIFDFLNGEEIDDIKTPDEEMKEWRKKKSERKCTKKC